MNPSPSSRGSMTLLIPIGLGPGGVSLAPCWDPLSYDGPHATRHSHPYPRGMLPPCSMELRRRRQCLHRLWATV
jgi:hypothetical protein